MVTVMPCHGIPVNGALRWTAGSVRGQPGHLSPSRSLYCGFKGNHHLNFGPWLAHSCVWYIRTRQMALPDSPRHHCLD